jgi:hypothetical protein
MLGFYLRGNSWEDGEAVLRGCWVNLQRGGLSDDVLRLSDSARLIGLPEDRLLILL